MSAVRMRFLAADEIARYVAGGEWRGKAGGYGIQDKDPFVTRVSGCHTNIVGLPMPETRRLLAAAGVTPREGGAGGTAATPSPAAPE
jgi:septum formation protein